MLTQLDTAQTPSDMAVPPWRLHSLHGAFERHWSVTMNGNWRMTFHFMTDGKIELVDYQDY